MIERRISWTGTDVVQLPVQPSRAPVQRNLRRHRQRTSKAPSILCLIFRLCRNRFRFSNGSQTVVTGLAYISRSGSKQNIFYSAFQVPSKNADIQMLYSAVTVAFGCFRSYSSGIFLCWSEIVCYLSKGFVRAT